MKDRQYELVPRWHVTWASRPPHTDGWVTHTSQLLSHYDDAASLANGLKTSTSVDCVEVTGPIYVRRPMSRLATAIRKAFA